MVEGQATKVCPNEGLEDYPGDLLVSLGGKEAAGILLEGGRETEGRKNLLDSGHQDFGTLLSLSHPQDLPPEASGTSRPH